MTLLIGAWTIGLILSLLALGVFISFRIFDFPDITTEGSITVGAAVAATLLAKGMDPFLATTAGFCGGALAGGVLYAFFRTNLGTAMRAAGDNAQMIQALGANVGTMIIMGLALANGLIALSGALLAQYQGFADVQMGIGMVVWGLASVIIGEALIG